MSGKNKRALIATEVARGIRNERQRRGLSLNRLAKLAGLSRQMVSYIEQCERNPTLDTLLRIADVFEMPLDSMLRKARVRTERIASQPNGDANIER